MKIAEYIKQLNSESQKRPLVGGEQCILDMWNKNIDLQTDLDQGRKCNDCLKDQLKNGKHDCAVHPDGCNVDGLVQQLRAKDGELEASLRIARRQKANLWVNIHKDDTKIKQLESENAKLQKQSDLLTLGLLQEKNKVGELENTLALGLEMYPTEMMLIKGAFEAIRDATKQNDNPQPSEKD